MAEEKSKTTLLKEKIMMHPEIREVWGDYIKKIVETIYKINRPVTQKVRLTKIE